MAFIAASNDLLFPISGTILVTGSNGHVASNIITEALLLGFKVRGTVRNPDSIPVLDKLYNNPNYSSVVIKDFITPGAFNEVVHAVDAIILTATPLPGPVDPNDIVPQTVAYAENVAKSALASQTVKRIVWTGSIPIVFKPGVTYKQDRNTWADDAVKAAWAPPPYTPDRAWINYKAAKDAAERALFEFAKRENAHYTVNSVLPCCIFGRIITQASDTGTWPQQILNGSVPSFGGNGRMLSPFIILLLYFADIIFYIEWYVDMVDVSRIHLAAAFDKTIVGERFIAAASKFDWNELIDTIQKISPSANVAPRFPEPVDKDLGDNDFAPGEAVLKKWWRQDSYKSLEQTLRENLAADL